MYSPEFQMKEAGGGCKLEFGHAKTQKMTFLPEMKWQTMSSITPLVIFMTVFFRVEAPHIRHRTTAWDVAWRHGTTAWDVAWGHGTTAWDVAWGRFADGWLEIISMRGVQCCPIAHAPLTHVHAHVNARVSIAQLSVRTSKHTSLDMSEHNYTDCSCPNRSVPLHEARWFPLSYP